MPFRDIMRDYRRAAVQRFEDACELMENPTRDSERSDMDTRHLCGARYLAGYAVECLLKAYLIQQMNAQTLNEAMELLDRKRTSQGLKPVANIARTAAGHRISYLVMLTDLKNYPGYDNRLWERVAAWSSSWRYESDRIKRESVEGFMVDVEDVIKWLQPKIGR